MTWDSGACGPGLLGVRGGGSTDVCDPMGSQLRLQPPCPQAPPQTLCVVKTLLIKDRSLRKLDHLDAPASFNENRPLFGETAWLG